VLAILTRDDQDLSTAVIGHGSNAHAAAKAALDAHRARGRQALGLPTRPSSGGLSENNFAPADHNYEKKVSTMADWIAPLTELPVVRSRVAVSQDHIRTLLGQAMIDGRKVKISGHKTDGTSFTDRLVEPKRIQVRADAWSSPYDPKDLLHVYDPTLNEPRVFRLDLIERVEVAA
jgi:hypothetical protein